MKTHLFLEHMLEVLFSKPAVSAYSAYCGIFYFCIGLQALSFSKMKTNLFLDHTLEVLLSKPAAGGFPAYSAVHETVASFYFSVGLKALSFWK